MSHYDSKATWTTCPNCNEKQKASTGWVTCRSCGERFPA